MPVYTIVRAINILSVGKAVFRGPVAAPECNTMIHPLLLIFAVFCRRFISHRPTQ